MIKILGFVLSTKLIIPAQPVLRNRLAKITPLC